MIRFVGVRGELKTLKIFLLLWVKDLWNERKSGRNLVKYFKALLQLSWLILKLPKIDVKLEF